MIIDARQVARAGLFAAAVVSAGGAVCAQSEFATSVVEYRPAPGQFVNNALFNDPSRALGAPVGGGTSAGDNSKVVSLGGFGGSIVLAFDHTVMDEPCNPFGLDAIIFGNSFWQLFGGSNQPTRRFAEAGVIEICFDANGNDVPDDGWFVIPGSSVPAMPPDDAPMDVLTVRMWDNNAGTPTPPSNVSWYPAGAPSPMVTETYLLPAAFAAAVLVHPSGSAATVEVHYGYADVSPTAVLGDTDGDDVVDDPSAAPEEFYTNPDNPFAVGLTEGAGGGDAFDIAWAVDGATGEPARVPGFDFIRISTGIDHIAGPLGEISTEVAAVSDVRERVGFFDLTSDDTVNVEDLYEFHALREGGDLAADLSGNHVIDERDRALLTRCVRRLEMSELAQ